ncbi:MAG TPA: pseudouridine synthase [Verrucomicrobiae bacterium]|nr:pseudouridine synthase [Verrucomicrobiae bacterium]
MIPCVIHEDDHLLVVNKPAGMNTHAPSPHAGEGIYDWLRHREPRWASLAIIHRLDKETSGVIVFSRTNLANRSLTEQFERRTVQKKYVFLTDRPVRERELNVATAIVRVGEKYVSRPLHATGERAETLFRVVGSSSGRTTVEAEPLTGRTHQIRVHAAASGFPILGDVLYGGTSADRVCLHAGQIVFRHPATGKEVTFAVPVDFSADARVLLRSAVIDSGATDAYRLIHGASDGWPGWYVDRLGDFLLSQSERELNDSQRETLAVLLKQLSLRGAYHKILTRELRKASPAQASPKKGLGCDAPDDFVARENGMSFVLRFQEGYSVGLFLDQRDNRRRFLANHVGAEFPLFANSPDTAKVLNLFAYTCAFSVCAAKAGARTTSVDLSKKYLEWGRRNFVLNDLDPARHDFIYGDAFDWMRRLAKKQRKFEVIVLDPPTYSQSKGHGAFQAEKDYGELVNVALPLLAANGVLLASTNAAKLPPERFLGQVTAAIHSTRRKVVQQHYVPQPPDFPVGRDEPAYLKTVWMRIE